MKTIFFDIGGVLLFFNHKLMCDQVANFCGLSEKKIQTFFFKEEFFLKYELGLLNDKKLYEILCNMAKKALDFSGLMHAISSIFSPNLEMLPLLQTLKNKGKKLYILSNTNKAHYNYIKNHYQFLNFFDGSILSYEIKMRKPDPEIFIHALNWTKNSAQDCFYIDDLLENIQAAKKLGIDSYQFISVKEFSKELELREVL